MAKAARQVFPKTSRILRRAHFHKIMRTGSRVLGASVHIYYRPVYRQTLRIGITVSKKQGKAYIRNRMKRLIREAFRLLWARLPKGYDIHVLPAQKGVMLDLRSIICDFERFQRIVSQ